MIWIFEVVDNKSQPSISRERETIVFDWEKETTKQIKKRNCGPIINKREIKYWPMTKIKSFDQLKYNKNKKILNQNIIVLSFN